MPADPNSILLNEINEKLSLIIKKLNIVPDIQITITVIFLKNIDCSFMILGCIV